MKKKSLLLVPLLALLLTSCGNEVVPTSITIIEPVSTTLEIGDSVTLEVLFEPEGVTEKGLIWTVEGSAVSAGNGVVEALEAGTATVKVTSEAVSSLSDEIVFTVNAPIVDQLPESLEITTSANAAVSYLDDPEKLQLKYEILPADTVNKNVIWEVIEGDDYAEVSEEGVITPLAQGDATIKISSQAVPSLTDEIVVRVLPIEYPTAISLSHPIATLELNKTLQLAYVILPTIATHKQVEWTVQSGTELVEVSEAGLVTPLAKGEAVVRVASKIKPAVYAESRITVIDPIVIVSPEEVTITTEGPLTLNIRAKVWVNASILPANVTNSTIKWKSEPSGILSITDSAAGAVEIQAVSYGSAILTAYAEADNEIKDTIEVTVVGLWPEADLISLYGAEVYANVVAPTGNYYYQGAFTTPGVSYRIYVTGMDASNVDAYKTSLVEASYSLKDGKYVKDTIGIKVTSLTADEGIVVQLDFTIESNSEVTFFWPSEDIELLVGAGVIPEFVSNAAGATCTLDMDLFFSDGLFDIGLFGVSGDEVIAFCGELFNLGYGLDDDANFVLNTGVLAYDLSLDHEVLKGLRMTLVEMEGITILAFELIDPVGPATWADAVAAIQTSYETDISSMPAIVGSHFGVRTMPNTSEDFWGAFTMYISGAVGFDAATYKTALTTDELFMDMGGILMSFSMGVGLEIVSYPTAEITILNFYLLYT